MHVIYSFPAETVKNVENVPPSFPDLEFIEPSVDFSPNLEKGNEKTHKIADSYRAKEPDVAGKSNVSSDQSRQTVITIDHVSPDQRPPYGRPPMPPTEVEVFKPPTKPAAFPSGEPAPFPPSRPGLFHPGRPVPYPPSRPDLFPPSRPGLYPPNVPLPPDVEVFNPSNVPPSPDVEVFNPSDVRQISFPTNVADIEVVPFDKNAIKSQVAVNDSSMNHNLYSTLDIPEESQESYSSYPSWNATKVYADYERLLKFLDSEESPADAVQRSSSSSSLPELEHVSGIATTEPPAKSYIASKESHDFIVRIYHNPPKMCYHILRGDNHEEPEKCITFSKNTTSKGNVTEGKNSDDAENVDHSSEIVYQPTNSTLMKMEDKYEMLQSEVIERETFNEVNSSNEDVPQSTPPTLQDIKFERAAENSLEDDNVEVKKLIDFLLVKHTLSKEAAADETDKSSSTEFPGAQETTTEKILLAEESPEVKNASTQDSSEKSGNGKVSDKMQQNNTSDQILATDAKISEDPIASSIDEQMISSEKFQVLCRLLAEYFVDRMQISSASSKSVSGNEDFDEYVLSPVLPLSYEEPLVTGRSADNSDELVSLLNFVDLVLPESNINSFDRSVLPSGAVNEANSEMYLVSQQPESMRSAESYFSPPEEVIVPLELDGYV